MDELQDLRKSGIKVLAGLCWLCTLASVLIAFMGAGSAMFPLAAAAIAVLPTFMAQAGHADPASRIVVALSVVLYPAIFVSQASGGAWQVDMHMTFFAALATLAVMADWRAVIVGAAVAAVHHLAVNLVAPALVFPEGASLLRVMFHAVVVVVETGALVFLCVKLEALVMQQADAHSQRLRTEAAAAALRAQVEADQRVVINALDKRLHDLSDGELAGTIDVTFPAAYEGLRTSCNSATVRLAEMVRTVSSAVEQIRHGAAEIRSASDDLAQRTEEQAASVEHNTRITTRLATNVGDTARTAGEVNSAIGGTRNDADRGGEVVGSAVAAMREIESSAVEIGQIVTLIDGIAFQTNLLALNAGVEAARAGDSGKGFAVVANEVRALAQRSADAASTIRDLIGASSAQVERGAALVSETGDVLRRIADQVANISGAVGEIAGASKGQSDDLGRISDSFLEIDRMTQQNAAMVEQSTAAAHGLARSADHLASLVAQFDVAQPSANTMPIGRATQDWRTAA